MKTVRIVFLLLLPAFAFSQPQKAVERLIDQYAATLYEKPDSALYYIKKATAESQKLRNHFLMARCFYNLGYYYSTYQDTTKARQYISQSLPHAKKSSNFKIIALAYNQLGLLDMDQSHYQKSLKNLLYSLEIAEKNKLSKNQCNALNNLALLFEIQKDTLKALSYYKRSETLASQNNFEEILMQNAINTGILKRHSDPKTAIKDFKKAYELALKLKDIQTEFNILINLSDVYISLNKAANAYESLQKANEKAIAIGRPDNLFFVHFNLGGYYMKTKKYPLALAQYQTALKLPDAGVSHEQYVNLYGAIADVQKALGHYKEAYDYQQKFFTGKDSIFSVAKNRDFKDIQTKYEVSKKNLKINLLTREKEAERNKKILSIGLGVLLLLPLLFLLFFYRHRIRTQSIIAGQEQQLHQKETQALRQQQELKRIKGVIQGQDEERNRLAKEIHDGVGGKLAGIKLSLSAENSVLENQALSALESQLGGLFQELRAISHNLSQHYIKDKPFAEVLDGLKEEYEARQEFTTELVIFPPKSLDLLPENTRHQLHRILQELLANISRHAKASNVLVSLTAHDDVLSLIVEDDGIGFSENRQKGIGLKNIEERLYAINGTLSLDSAPGKGTTIIIEIPTQNFSADD